MSLRRFATLLLTIIVAGGAMVARGQVPVHDYRKAFLSLYRAVQQQFYDSVSGYYRDYEMSAPKYGYAYCWPLCGLLQAYNEAEAAGIAGDRQTMPGGRADLLDGHDAQQASGGRDAAGGSGYPSVKAITALLGQYKSNKPPMLDSGGAPIPGYDSYIVRFGGGDRFYDDNQWLGLAWMDAWFRLREPALLERGKLIYRFMLSGYDTVTGGGLYWEEGKMTTKNTCSNGPGIVLALQLYKATREKKYLDTALLLYRWVDQHLRDTADGLYFDNIRTLDHRIGRRKFSYNTGTMLQSNVYLYELTGDPVWLQRAKALADTAARYFYGSGKFRDGYWFNAVLVRGYVDLLKFYHNPAYLEAIRRCVDESLDNDMAPTGVMGSRKQQLLVNQAGMLEMLARLVRMQE